MAVETWWMVGQAAPYILFGLFAAGLIHVLLPESLVLRWMGRPGLSGVVRAALIGVPLPVCSCGVVPITVELERKGASRPAAQSFLITTPESSIDSIFLTWGMMGPVMAIARPIAAFFTAVVGGVLTIGNARSVSELSACSKPGGCRSNGQAPAPHDEHGHEHHEHSHSHSLAFADSAKARQALRGLFDPKAESGRLKRFWKDLLRPAIRYGFVELVDDLAFWLLVGLVFAGALTAFLPDDLGGVGLGGGLTTMLLLLVVGVPLYMCASASTPIAAALLAKGVSPGAALVFLLAGPATNAATVLLLAGTFGRRFVRDYVASVVIGALAAGLVLDALMGPELIDVGSYFAADAPGVWSLLAALGFAALLIYRLWRGSWAAGVGELRDAYRRLRPHIPVPSRRFAVIACMVLAVAAYLSTGLRVVPPGSHGYAFRLGALHQSDLEPGLHYSLPYPLGTWELRRVRYARKSDVGFRTDLDLIARRRELIRMAPPGEWHSPVAAMNADPIRATYLTADENLVEMTFSVHYALSDPVSFFYGVDHSRDFIRLYAESVARELVASTPLDDLLTGHRTAIQQRIRSGLQELLDRSGVGVAVNGIQIVDIHPPGDAVFAFRDVSSALEDRETQIYKSRQLAARALPRARGRAARIVAEAEAEADRSVREAAARRESFLARAEPYGRHRDLIGHLIWIETAERVLSGREKYIVPPGRGSRGVTLWQDDQPGFPTFPQEEP